MTVRLSDRTFLFWVLIMKRRFREWFSIKVSQQPGQVVLFAILVFNLLFFLVGALVIMILAGQNEMSFFEALYCTITMILDAGCIEAVVGDVGAAGYLIPIICIGIVIIGMITFSGAVIGYVTNYISGFIENSNSGNTSINVSEHVIILNWNSRASEIINDFLYAEHDQIIVVLSDMDKDEITREVGEKLQDTIRQENTRLKRDLAGRPFFERNLSYNRRKLKNNLTVVVRQGDIFSANQLHNISLLSAKSVIILDDEQAGSKKGQTEGNSKTIKALMQVADIVSKDISRDNQRIVVEINDDWTEELVGKIIRYKQIYRKCTIVPIRVNVLLGQLLSQFSVMPNLNLAYRELFSNKGATFYVDELKTEDPTAYITDYINTHDKAIPLVSRQVEGHNYFYYAASSPEDLKHTTTVPAKDIGAKLNLDYWLDKKNILILGHNSNCTEMMKSFQSFSNEWNYRDTGEQILNINIIDDAENLKKMDFYKEYPFVTKTIAASIFDKDLMCKAIERFFTDNKGDISVLILSDDMVDTNEQDSAALANLVYIQEIISDRAAADVNFNPDRIDIVVEIVNPRHHDIVNSYSVRNVVISNRYISKMITQIGEKDAIFDFYNEILTYDDADAEVFNSEEIYIKKADTFFDEIPPECSPRDLIYSVWKASTDPSIPKEEQTPTLILGYVKREGNVCLFNSTDSPDTVKLDKGDKLIVYANH